MQRCLTHSILKQTLLSSAAKPLGSVRTVSGGYNEDATEQGSVVSGTNPKPSSSLIGHSYRPSLPGPEHFMEPVKKDEFANVLIEEGESLLAITAQRTHEMLHPESFAFQEWGEVRKGLVRNYRDRQKNYLQKWDVAEEEMETSWRYHPGYLDSTEHFVPYGAPEDQGFHPRPQPHSSTETWRHSTPIIRRNQQRHYPTPNSWRVEPMSIPKKYLMKEVKEGF